MLINELFALPVGLKLVVNVDGIPLYGNQIINDKFIQAIRLSKRGKKIFELTKRLVNNGTIIPCFADAGVLSYFKRRISQDTSGGLLRVLRIILVGKKIDNPLDWCLAFFHFPSKKIIVLISNHITEKFSMTASNESLALALTHEMMHMYAHQNPNKFLSFFKDELTSYYKNYFVEILDLEEGNENLDLCIQSFYKSLFIKCELSTSNVSLMEIYKQLKKLKPFSKFDDEKFKNVCMEYLRLVRLLLTTDMSTVISVTKVKYKHLIKPLYSCYSKSFGKIPQKGCMQELYIVSEVICGFSDTGISSKIKTALNSLDL